MCKIKPFEHCNKCDGLTLTDFQVTDLIKKIAFKSRVVGDDIYYEIRGFDIPQEVKIYD